MQPKLTRSLSIKNSKSTARPNGLSISGNFQSFPHLSLPSTTRNAPSSQRLDQDEEVLRRNIQLRQALELEKGKKLIKDRSRTREEMIHTFLFEKKIHNKVRYNDTSKINIHAAPVHRGTISLMLNIRQKEEGLSLTNLKSKVSSKAKLKIKWKAIQWLLDNKKDVIDQLCSQYEFIGKLFKSKGSGESLNREKFGELLSYVGINGERALADKLFYIFDEDGNGLIDYRELILGLETFKDNSFEDKLQVFFSLCDVDGSGFISKKELYDVLKRTCATEDEKIKLKRTIRVIFAEADLDHNWQLEKNELFQYAKKNEALKSIIEESVRSIRKIDKMIENDLDEPFSNWVPLSGSLMNSKEGVHFPLVRKFIDAMGEQETYKHETKKAKQEIAERLRKLRVINGQEPSDSEDDS